jgi:hypothetical protein
VKPNVLLRSLVGFRNLPRNDTLVFYRCNDVTHEWIVWSPVVGWVERSETQRSAKVACWVSQAQPNLHSFSRVASVASFLAMTLVVYHCNEVTHEWIPLRKDGTDGGPVIYL